MMYPNMRYTESSDGVGEICCSCSIQMTPPIQVLYLSRSPQVPGHYLVDICTRYQTPSDAEKASGIIKFHVFD